MSTFDNFTYTGACSGFHWHIERGLSQPYPRELQLVKNYLSKYPNKNTTYIDIGAHIGTTALPYSRLFKNVIVYEANTDNYKHLVKNINCNKCTNIIAKNIGVSDVTTRAKVVKHGENSGCYYIEYSTENNAVATENNAIDVVKLDDEGIDGPVDFIKIDTEGSELYVLRGSKKLIEKYKPLIQVETNSSSNKFFNYDKEEIFKFMTDIGYSIFDDDGNDPLFYFENS